MRKSKKELKSGVVAPEPEKKEVTAPKPEPYIVYGSEVTVLDKEFVDYYKTRMKMMLMRFQLVGKFTTKGGYIISKDIRRDLVQMNKEISGEGEDFFKASTLYMKKMFYFTVEISELENGRAIASLYLAEYVEEYLPENFIYSHIADYEDDFTPAFRDKVREVFHLNDTALKNEDQSISDLAVLMQDERDVMMVVGGLYDIASQIYVMRLLKALEEAGEKGQKVVQRYKQLLNESLIPEEGKQKYSNLKALLDRAVDEAGGLEKLPIKKEVLASIVTEINSSVRAIDGAQKKPGAIEGMKAQKLEKIIEEKSSSGGKSGKKPAKKKAGKKDGGGKKKDKGKKDSGGKDKKSSGGVTLDDDKTSDKPKATPGSDKAGKEFADRSDEIRSLQEQIDILENEIEELTDELDATETETETRTEPTERILYDDDEGLEWESSDESHIYLDEDDEELERESVSETSDSIEPKAMTDEEALDQDDELVDQNSPSKDETSPQPKQEDEEEKTDDSEVTEPNESEQEDEIDSEQLKEELSQGNIGSVTIQIEGDETTLYIEETDQDKIDKTEQDNESEQDDEREM